MTISEDELLSTAPINASDAGDTTIIAASPGQILLVYSFALICDAAVSINWKHGTTDYHPPMPFLQGGAWDKQEIGGSPLFRLVGESLILTLSDAVAVTGIVWYRFVRALT